MQLSAVECSQSLSHSACLVPEEGVTIHQEGTLYSAFSMYLLYLCKNKKWDIREEIIMTVCGAVA